MSEKVVLANWKASLSPLAVGRWCDAFAGQYRPSRRLRVVLAVPFLVLADLQSRCRDLPGVVLAAQDVSPFPQGGYTGATPADWLRGLADYVLVGHRERRRYFHETNQDAANKVSEALAAELQPVLCVNRAGLAGHVAIVGAGPAGVAAGLACRERGLRFGLFDQDGLGGSVNHYPRRKLVMTAPAELPGFGTMKVREVRKEELLEFWNRVVRETKLEIRAPERVSEVRHVDGGFEVVTEKGTARARRVVLAVGRRGPSPPDRHAAWIAGMVRFVKLSFGGRSNGPLQKVRARAMVPHAMVVPSL